MCDKICNINKLTYGEIYLIEVTLTSSMIVNTSTSELKNAKGPRQIISLCGTQDCVRSHSLRHSPDTEQKQIYPGPLPIRAESAPGVSQTGAVLWVDARPSRARGKGGEQRTDTHSLFPRFARVAGDVAWRHGRRQFPGRTIDSGHRARYHHYQNTVAIAALSSSPSSSLSSW